MQFTTEHHLLPGDKVHEANGPILAMGARFTALFSSGLVGDESGVICEQGDHLSGWALYLIAGEFRWVLAMHGRTHAFGAPVPPGTRSLAFSLTPGHGSCELEMRADSDVIGLGVCPETPPATFSPDGSFLTVGYARPFAVSDDFVPPAAAPTTFAGLRVDVGAAPELDFDSEFDRVMRHQ